MSRDLTPAQQAKLDKLDPGVKVIGWDSERQGPVIRALSGKTNAISIHGRVVSTVVG